MLEREKVDMLSIKTGGWNDTMVKLNKSNNIRNKTRLLLLISIIINIYKIDKRIQVKFI